MELRSPPPAGCGGLVGGPIFCGSARYQAASTLLPLVDSGRVEWLVLHNSYSQSAVFAASRSGLVGAPIFCGSARYQAASTLLPLVDSGRVEWLLLHNSYSQSAILPSA